MVASARSRPLALSVATGFLILMSPVSAAVADPSSTLGSAAQTQSAPGVKPTPTPTPDPELQPALNLVIHTDNGVSGLPGGGRATYATSVVNLGASEAKVTIRVDMPAVFVDARTEDGNAITGPTASWPVTIAPGDTFALRLSGSYASPKTPGMRVAFTACALARSDNTALVCSTDIDDIPLQEASGASWLWWLLLPAGLTVAGGGLLLMRRPLMRRPSLRRGEPSFMGAGLSFVRGALSVVRGALSFLRPGGGLSLRRDGNASLPRGRAASWTANRAPNAKAPMREPELVSASLAPDGDLPSPSVPSPSVSSPSVSSSRCTGESESTMAVPVDAPSAWVGQSAPPDAAPLDTWGQPPR